MRVQSFNFFKSVSLDYMHCILLGIVRLLAKLWFTTKYSVEPFSLCNFIEIVDARISGIKPPHTIARMPRTISEHFKFWKAAELRSWLFYYSLPVLHDIMQPRFLYHYAARGKGCLLTVPGKYKSE